MELLIATNNQGKVTEIKNKLADLPFEVFSLKDKEIQIDVIEDGTTFEENALKKAREVCALSHIITIADDSGLEVEYLNNAPGIYSARYAGPNASDQDLYTKLLKELENVPQEKRGARFVSVIAIVYPDGKEATLRGECYGTIANAPAGTGGFGYDPVFFVPEQNKTFSQLSLEEKNKISHRAKALDLLKIYLKQQHQ